VPTLVKSEKHTDKSEKHIKNAGIKKRTKKIIIFKKKLKNAQNEKT
jgi:hypothetical protein